MTSPDLLQTFLFFAAVIWFLRGQHPVTPSVHHSFSLPLLLVTWWRSVGTNLRTAWSFILGTWSAYCNVPSFIVRTTSPSLKNKLISLFTRLLQFPSTSTPPKIRRILLLKTWMSCSVLLLVAHDSESNSRTRWVSVLCRLSLSIVFTKFFLTIVL